MCGRALERVCSSSLDLYNKEESNRERREVSQNGTKDQKGESKIKDGEQFREYAVF